MDKTLIENWNDFITATHKDEFISWVMDKIKILLEWLTKVIDRVNKKWR